MRGAGANVGSEKVLSFGLQPRGTTMQRQHEQKAVFWEAAYWLRAGVLGAAGGVLYWLLADQVLGITHGLLVERIMVGVMAGLAFQVVQRLRHGP